MLYHHASYALCFTAPSPPPPPLLGTAGGGGQVLLPHRSQRLRVDPPGGAEGPSLRETRQLAALPAGEQ